MSEADYSPDAAFRQNRKKCYQLLEEIELLLMGKPPKGVNFTHVGNVVEARSHLEKARYYLKSHGYAEDRRE